MTSVGFKANNNKVLFFIPLKKKKGNRGLYETCIHMFGSSGVLFMSTQSYFLSEICVIANQLHRYCLPIVILSISKLHRFSVYSPRSTQMFWGHLYAISP